MKKLSFSGRIFPASASVTVNDHPSITWKSQELDFTMTCKVNIANNIVTIDCEIDNFEPVKHFTPVLMRAYDTAKSTIDLVSFSTGNGLFFILENFTAPDGQTTPVLIQNPNLAPLSTAVSQLEDFDKVLKIVLQEPPLFLALRELIEAVTQFHVAPTSAARSVERVREIVAPHGDRKQSWKKFREDLNFTEAFLKLITDISAGPRHGDSTHIPGSVTTEVAKRAWIVMNRCLEFRKRGNKPLPTSEFPLL